jgi:hypothetical protein
VATDKKKTTIRIRQPAETVKHLCKHLPDIIIIILICFSPVCRDHSRIAGGSPANTCRRFQSFKIDRQHVTHGAPPMAGKPGHAKQNRRISRGLITSWHRFIAF